MSNISEYMYIHTIHTLPHFVSSKFSCQDRQYARTICLPTQQLSSRKLLKELDTQRKNQFTRFPNFKWKPTQFQFYSIEFGKETFLCSLPKLFAQVLNNILLIWRGLVVRQWVLDKNKILLNIPTPKGMQRGTK